MTELDLTLRLPRRVSGRVDVRVRAAAGCTLADLSPLLEELVGVSGCVASCAGEVLDPTTRLGVPPLVHGATLVLGEGLVGGGRGRGAVVAAAPVDLVVVAGPDAGRRVRLTTEGVVVGREAGLGLSLADPRLSRRHVHVRPGDHGFRVTDLSSTNGTRCGDVVLAPGGIVEVDGAHLIAVGDSLLRLVRGVGTTAPTLARGDGRVCVNRSPRTRPPDVRLTVTAPTPPSAPHRGRIPWVAAVLPLPFAAVLAAFFGPQMLAFALLSPVVLVGTVVGDRWAGRRDHARALVAHEAERGQRRAELEAWRLLEREERWRDTPDPATVLAVATGPGTRLWERRPSGPDFGRVRVGVGDLPSRTGWSTATGEVEHACLPDLPVEVDLATVHGLGVAGPAQDVEQVLTHVLGQVVTLHSPRDLQVVVATPVRCAPSDPEGSFAWARWLPHTTVHASLQGVLETLRGVVAARESGRDRGVPAERPRLLVVLPDCGDDLDAGELVDLLERGRAVGVWCLAGARTAAALPATCGAVLDLARGSRDGAGRLDVDGSDPVTSFTPDQVHWWWGERIGRALAPLVDASGEADRLPTVLDLLDLLPWTDAGVTPTGSSIAQHWRQASGRPVAHLGRTAGDDWVVDLAADGPHVLVGGTTGSGKSELLRTLVTSLALECSPAALTFVLVDYKGGAAFGDCAQLPHTVGMVTNLDEGLARRALTSLRAEISRRERLLAASGARDFDDHARRVGGLARLVIVIDEFRLLADELPDFVDGVVSLAAVGRSLGVHLVLATQRPAGAVTADIQANVNLRIAMRVRDAADSTDVIEAPDAAHVRVDRPGRGFARGGDGTLVEFQAARVGQGREGATTRLEVLDATGAPTAAHTTSAPSGGAASAGVEDDAIALISAAAEEAVRICSIPAPHRPWLPPLPESARGGDLGGGGVGLVDLPDEQRQSVLVHRPDDGHWVLAGGPRSGRTTCLRTVVASWAADGAGTTHVYAIDTRGELADLESLPQVGAVVAADDLSRVRRLAALLRALPEGGDVPSVLLVVDGWDRLDPDGDLVVGGPRDELLDLLRRGGSTLRAVVAGDRSVLTGRLGAVASETFLLPVSDPSDATYAGLSPRDLPSSRAPGRAVRLRDRREVQFSRRDPLAEAVPPPLGTVAPTAVPRLPRTVHLDELLDAVALEEAERSGSGRCGPALDDRRAGWSGRSCPLPIGLSAQTGGVAWLDLDRERRVLVAGHPGSGRSTTLATIASAALAAGRPVVVVEMTGAGVGAEVSGAVAVDPWHPAELVEARRTHPDLVVLVDDAERLEGTPVEPVLREIGALVERDGGALVVATTLSALSTQFRGVVPEVARGQCGVLLGPRGPGDGEPFGIRAPRGLAAITGRGLLVVGRRTVEIQVARATPVAVATTVTGPDDDPGGVPLEHPRWTRR